MTIAIPQQPQPPTSSEQQQQQQHLLVSPSFEALDCCGETCFNLYKEQQPDKKKLPQPQPQPQPQQQLLLLVPSIGKLSGFLCTTCFLWMSEPILALIDTSFVSWTHMQYEEQEDQYYHHEPGQSGEGRPSLVIQLASMGLATTFMDTLVYMTYFLAIATTTQIAEQVAYAHRHVRQLQLTTSRLLGFAVLCGSLVTCLTWLSGHHFLQLLARQSGEEAPELVPLATKYVQIRALVAPLTVAGMVAHSFCLVTDHIHTVAIAVLTSAITNIVLDWMLCPRYGMLGAASATAMATSLSAGILLRQVYMQMKVWRNREMKQEEKFNKSDAAVGFFGGGENMDNPDDDYDEYDGEDEDLVLEGRLRVQLLDSDGSNPTTTFTANNKMQPTVPLISLPDRDALVHLLKLSLPLAFYMWAETASYASLTISATKFGPVAMAAQNVLMQVFHFLCCISESLSQAAQTFLPATLYPRYHEQSFWQVLMRLGRVAAVVAVLGYQFSLLLLGEGGNSSSTETETGVVAVVTQSRLSSLLQDSLDPQVVEQLQLACPYLALCLCLHPFNAVIEGTVLATRDFGNIVRTYTVTLLLFGLVLKFATESLAGVWRALVVWQLLRMANYGFWRRRKSPIFSPSSASSSSPSPPSSSSLRQSSFSGSVELKLGRSNSMPLGRKNPSETVVPGTQ